MILKIFRMEHNRFVPEYKTEGAAGMDLCAAISESITLRPLERCLVPTGLKIELEHGYEAQIRPRSGLSIKHGISLINCVGTIDEDYRGEVCVPVEQPLWHLRKTSAILPLSPTLTTARLPWWTKC